MMSLCVSVCLSMGGFSGGLMHGCVWWGCAQSRLSVSGLMCLHDVACCLGVSSMGAFDGVGMVLSLCVWCYAKIMDGKTYSLSQFWRTFCLSPLRHTSFEPKGGLKHASLSSDTAWEKSASPFLYIVWFHWFTCAVWDLCCYVLLFFRLIFCLFVSCNALGHFCCRPPSQPPPRVARSQPSWVERRMLPSKILWSPTSLRRRTCWICWLRPKVSAILGAQWSYKPLRHAWRQ